MIKVRSMLSGSRFDGHCQAIIGVPRGIFFCCRASNDERPTRAGDCISAILGF
jgi:hypothetical protein